MTHKNGGYVRHPWTLDWRQGVRVQRLVHSELEDLVQIEGVVWLEDETSLLQEAQGPGIQGLLLTRPIGQEERCQPAG